MGDVSVQLCTESEFTARQDLTPQKSKSDLSHADPVGYADEKRNRTTCRMRRWQRWNQTWHAGSPA
jgi:hypothetical protein